MNKTLKRAGIIGATLGGITAITIASFAFFTGVSSVTATGDVASVKVAHVSNASVQTIAPGYCSDVSFTLTNPGDVTLHGPFKISEPVVNASAEASPYIHPTDAFKSGATQATNPLLQAANVVIPAGESRTVTFPNVVCAGFGLPDAAQGQSISVAFDVTMKQANGTEYNSNF